MPTLDELRRWARGEPVEGLPPVSLIKEVERPRLVPMRSTGKYRINADGTDALLQFGRFRGHTLSKLVMTARGRKYLHWILDKDFDENLKEVCRYTLEAHKRVK